MTGAGCVVAFTGTLKGMTPVQMVALRSALEDVVAECPGAVLRHGAAIGADAEAHILAVALGMKPQLYPGHIASKSAVRRLASTADRVFPAANTLERNSTMVDGADLAFACPGSEVPDRYASGSAKGGTWSTVDKALKGGVRTAVITPLGDVVMPPVGRRYPF